MIRQKFISRQKSFIRQKSISRQKSIILALGGKEHFSTTGGCHFLVHPMTLSHCKCNFHQKMIAFHNKSKEIQVIAHSRLQGIAISKMNVKTQWKQQIPKGAKRPWGAAEGGAFVVFNYCLIFGVTFSDCFNDFHWFLMFSYDFSMVASGISIK